MTKATEALMERGYIHVYTGNGKGKTTAALGLALRAVGHGLRVLVIQFMKGERQEGEVAASKRLAPYLTIRRVGERSFLSKEHLDEEAFRHARWGLELACRAMEERSCDILVLDEVILAVDFGLVNLSDLLRLMDRKPGSMELVLTGRNACPEIVEKADLVTEMVERKHYFTEGVSAREGIEF